MSSLLARVGEHRRIRATSSLFQQGVAGVERQVSLKVVIMVDLKKLWEETKEFVHVTEQQIARKYINFLREVAKHYISRGKRVFFRENRVVHYGEGDFGDLLVECGDDEYAAFGAPIQEIEFQEKLTERDLRGYSEITMQSLENIEYRVD